MPLGDSRIGISDFGPWVYDGCHSLTGDSGSNRSSCKGEKNDAHSQPISRYTCPRHTLACCLPRLFLVRAAARFTRSQADTDCR